MPATLRSTFLAMKPWVIFFSDNEAALRHSLLRSWYENGFHGMDHFEQDTIDPAESSDVPRFCGDFADDRPHADEAGAH